MSYKIEFLGAHKVRSCLEAGRAEIALAEQQSGVTGVYMLDGKIELPEALKRLPGWRFVSLDSGVSYYMCYRTAEEVKQALES